MQAFGLSGDQNSAMAAYLAAMDRTAVGQARAPRPDPALFAAAVREALASEDVDVGKGAELFLTGSCSACHAALSAKRIGSYLAPDLSVSAGAMSDGEILSALETGRPAKGMPPTGLSAEQRLAVLDFLRWLADNRRTLLDRALEGQETGIPWWEFR